MTFHAYLIKDFKTLAILPVIWKIRKVSPYADMVAVALHRLRAWIEPWQSCADSNQAPIFQQRCHSEGTTVLTC